MAQQCDQEWRRWSTVVFTNELVWSASAYISVWALWCSRRGTPPQYIDGWDVFQYADRRQELWEEGTVSWPLSSSRKAKEDQKESSRHSSSLSVECHYILKLNRSATIMTGSASDASAGVLRTRYYALLACSWCCTSQLSRNTNIGYMRYCTRKNEICILWIVNASEVPNRSLI